MNNKIKRIIPQLLTILFVVFVFGFFTFNAQVNMDNRGIDFGFGFLKQEASFDMQFTLLDYDGQDSYLWAYVVALLNTLLVSFLGIIFCTILGVIIGVARLSSNYLIRNSAAWYVEFFRNIPLLLQIFFWYYAALRALPLPENAEPWFGVTYMTIKGYYIPAMIWQNLNIFMYCLIAAVVSIVFIRAYAKKLQETQGKQIPVFLISIGLIFILPIKISNIDIPFLITLLDNHFISSLFVLLCFLFVINGANLVDGFNGLLTINLLIINLVLVYINLSSNNLAFSFLIISFTSPSATIRPPLRPASGPISII